MKSLRYGIVAAVSILFLYHILDWYIYYRVSIALSSSYKTEISPTKLAKSATKHVEDNIHLKIRTANVLRRDFKIQIFIMAAGHMTSGSDENRYYILKYVLNHLDDPNIKIHIATNETKFLTLKPRWSPISFSNAVKGDGKVAIKYLDFNSNDFDYFIFMEDDILITATQIYRFIELKTQIEQEVDSVYMKKLGKRGPDNLRPLLTFVRYVSYGRTLRSENSYGPGGTFLTETIYQPDFEDFFSASFLFSAEQYVIMQNQRDLKRYIPDDTIGGSKVGGSPVWANMGLTCAFRPIWKIDRDISMNGGAKFSIDSRLLVGHMASGLMRLYDPHYGDNQPNRSNVFDMPLNSESSIVPIN